MVVKELEKPTSPKHIWCGEYDFAGWLMQFLPALMFKGMMERVTGLDAVMKAVQEQRAQ